MSSEHRYLSIDEEGYILLGDLRASDTDFGAEILQKMHYTDTRAFQSTYRGQDYIIEAFDQPYVAHAIDLNKQLITLCYGVVQSFDLEKLQVDQWDRFHGYTKSKIPFVLNRKAQAMLFEQCSEFDDDSITVGDKQIPITNYWSQPEEQNLESSFWEDLYKKDQTGWEMNQPSPVFVDMLPRLKMPRSRILVLGCGSAQDAAYFAREGHRVTAVDFSPTAIKKAKAQFGHIENLTFQIADAFALPASFRGSFDMIVEHTFYCAIDPNRRDELIKTWRQCLTDQGQVIGVFFAMERKFAPPFGGTEWELRQRLKDHFQFLFWGRWHQSIDGRYGKELFVLAHKKPKN